MRDLQIKSGLLKGHNLKPKGGFRLWRSYINNSQTARLKSYLYVMSKGKSSSIIFLKFWALREADSSFCLRRYKECPDGFSIQHKRKVKTRAISESIEHNIIKELQTEKNMIENPDIPLRHYNYSYVKNLLATKYSQ